MKDRSLRSFTFARMLLRDIEICALYKLKSADMHSYLSQLLISHHSQVSHLALSISNLAVYPAGLLNEMM